MAALETVRIKHPTKPGKYRIINKCDFDPAKHQLFEAKPQAEKPAAAKRATLRTTKST